MRPARPDDPAGLGFSVRCHCRIRSADSPVPTDWRSPDRSVAGLPARCASGNTRPARRSRRTDATLVRRKNTCTAIPFAVPAGPAARPRGTAGCSEKLDCRRSARQFGACTSSIVGQSDSSELPSGLRGKKVAIGRPDVGSRRDAGSTAEDDLVAHELTVILAERARCGLISRIRGVGAMVHSQTSPKS